MIEDNKIEALLAYALNDAENTCKMADLSEADRKNYFQRAVTLLRWIEFHGATVILKRKRGGDQT